MDIDVCVCTFRRTTLRETLQSLSRQVLPSHATIRVIVADNDQVPSAHALVRQAGAEFALTCHYVHAPARNISVARNACIDTATAPLLAFIDDDEVAEPTWLAELLAGIENGAGDIVFGPARARYADTAPAWARAVDLHSIRPVVRVGGCIETGYTSNVMMRRSAIAGVRFDPALGRSGGEDTVFFASLHRAGVSLGYCPRAIVHEDVPSARLRLRWLLSRAFRSGQAHGRILTDRSARPALYVPLAAAKAVYCVAGAALHMASAGGWRRYLTRAALHMGVVARLLGVRELQLY